MYGDGQRDGLKAVPYVLFGVLRVSVGHGRQAAFRPCLDHPGSHLRASCDGATQASSTDIHKIATALDRGLIEHAPGQ
jgi:hypothetical protein